MRDFLAFRDLRLSRLGAMAGGGGIVLSITTDHNGESITFDQVLTNALAADGKRLIVVPTGTAQILSRSTAATTVDGLAIHGTMKNPQRNTVQGWDERMGGFSAAASASFPITIQAGDVVVCCVSRTASLPTDSDIRDGVPERWAEFHVVASLPPDLTTYFAPAAIGWSGRGTPVGYTVNVNAAVAGLRDLDITGMPQPTYAQVMSHIGQHCPVIRYLDSDVPTGMEAYMPFRFGGVTGNYGQYLGSLFGAASMLLHSNALTTAEKRSMFKALLRHGIDAIDPCIGDAVVTSNGGGHTQFQLVIEAMAAYYTGRAALIPDLGVHDPQNATRQIFKMTSGLFADLAPHSSTSKPFLFRRRTIPAAGVSGLSITLPTFRSTLGDAVRMPTVGYTIVRESDGATGVVTGPGDFVVVPGGTSTVVYTIAAQPTPAFAPGDVVYFQPPYVQPVGEYDYSILGTVDGTGWQFYDSHVFGGAYRALNFWGDDVIALRLFGFYDPAFEALEGYAVSVNAGNYPDPANAFPNTNPVTDTTGQPAFTQAFWNRYSCDLIQRIVPVISGVTTAVAVSNTTCDYSTSHSSGTVYWLLSASATRTAAQIKAGGDLAAGSAAISAFGPQAQLSATGISDGTRYWHLLHEKTTGEQSAIASNSISISAQPFEFVSNISPMIDNAAGSAAFSFGTVPAGRYLVVVNARAAGGVADIPATLTVNGVANDVIAGSGAAAAVRSVVAAYIVDLAASYSGNWTLPTGNRRYHIAALFRIGARTVQAVDIEVAAINTQTLQVNTNAGDQVICYSAGKNANYSFSAPVTAVGSYTAVASLAASWGLVASAAAGTPTSYSAVGLGTNDPASGAIVLRLP